MIRPTSRRLAHYKWVLHFTKNVLSYTGFKRMSTGAIGQFDLSIFTKCSVLYAASILSCCITPEWCNKLDLPSFIPCKFKASALVSYSSFYSAILHVDWKLRSSVVIPGVHSEYWFIYSTMLWNEHRRMRDWHATEMNLWWTDRKQKYPQAHIHRSRNKSS